MMSSNSDQRANKRYEYEATIWHDNLFPDIFSETKMYNLSEGGIYFESDQTLYADEKIYIAIKDPSSSDDDYEDCFKVEIKWRKNLKDSLFRCGYGAQFIDSRNALIETIEMAHLSQDRRPENGSIDKNDSRQHPRSPYRKVIFFTTNSQNYKGFITNVSRSGAFIVTRQKLSLEQEITVVIPGGGKHSELKLKGHVARLSLKGVGVKFDRRTAMDRRQGGDRREKKAPAKKDANQG